MDEQDIGLRDYFAARAMQKMNWSKGDDDIDAVDCYKIADAMMKARVVEQPVPVAWMTVNAFGEDDDIWYTNPEGKLLEGWTYRPLFTCTPKEEK